MSFFSWIKGNKKNNKIVAKNVSGKIIQGSMLQANQYDIN
jgi:hypothetical protein